MITNEIEDFEDFLGVYTPSQVESSVRDLYSSWDRLYQANKKQKYIVQEYKSYKKWADSVLRSTTSKVFASGTLNELDGWKQRYKTAYNSANNKAGQSPETLDKPFQLSDLANNPWAWLGGAIFLSVIVGKLSR